MTTAKHPDAPDHCQFCEWTSHGLVNYGEHGQPQWLCHGCAGMMVRRALRQTKSTLVVDFNNPDDMLRHASLFTHDLALPSSTPGEVSLGRCVERLVDDRVEFKRVVAEQLHYDMQAILTGTPESRARGRIAALLKVEAFAKHRESCASVHGDPRCTCGLDAAREEAGL